MKSKQDIAELLEKIYNELQLTRESGQKEYAHVDDNAFGNFERLASELGISREKVLWIYAKKHLDGVLAHINGHKSQREDVRGRIKDVMVYLTLLWGMIDDNEEELNNRIREENIHDGPPNTTHIPGLRDSFVGRK